MPIDSPEYRQWQGAKVLSPKAFDPVLFMEPVTEYEFPREVKELRWK